MATPTLVYDVAIAMIAPLLVRVGQVLVVRGRSALVVQRGTTVAVAELPVEPEMLRRWEAAGVIRRRASGAASTAGAA